MATIITREVGATAKGTTLTNAEIDNNFINLNTELSAKANLESPTFSGTVTAGKISVLSPGGDEGGEINLALAVTNNLLSGSVAIDINQSQLRIFETGGSNRGVYINLASASSGVGTNLMSNASLVADDIPDLDASKITTGIIDAARLPSYVDDVLEAANLAAFPTTGQAGKIYVALDTNKTYRWGGSSYVYITSGAVDSVAGKTGIVTLVKGDVGLGNVDNTSDVNKPVSNATQVALNAKQDTLVSGTSVKTINSQSILGSGNIQIDGGVTSFNTRTGPITLSSTDVTTALGFTPLNSAVGILQNRYSYIATAGQTTFAATYAAPYVDVYLNGLRLSAGSDYTATNGTQVILTSAAVVNDLVEIVGQVLSSTVVVDSTKLSLTGGNLTGNVTFADTQTFPGTQATLVSGTNIKTINGTSILGSGDIVIGGGGGGVSSFNTRTGAVVLSLDDINTTVTSSYGVHLGTGAALSGPQSTAVGVNAFSSSASVAVGHDAQAVGAYTTAVGKGANASADSATALGYGAQATGLYTTAVGFGANVNTSNYGTALGQYCSVTGNHGLAAGAGSVASGSESIAIGRSTQASGSSSIAIGDSSNASAYGSVVLGQSLNANETNQFKVRVRQNPSGIVSPLTVQYDPANNEIYATNSASGGGVTQIIAGSNVTISSSGPNGTGAVTINATGGGGSTAQFYDSITGVFTHTNSLNQDSKVATSQGSSNGSGLIMPIPRGIETFWPSSWPDPTASYYYNVRLFVETDNPGFYLSSVTLYSQQFGSQQIYPSYQTMWSSSGGRYLYRIDFPGSYFTQRNSGTDYIEFYDNSSSSLIAVLVASKTYSNYQQTPTGGTFTDGFVQVEGYTEFSSWNQYAPGYAIMPAYPPPGTSNHKTISYVFLPSWHSPYPSIAGASAETGFYVRAMGSNIFYNTGSDYQMAQYPYAFGNGQITRAYIDETYMQAEAEWFSNAGSGNLFAVRIILAEYSGTKQ